MTDRYPRDTARIYAIADRVRFGSPRAAKASVAAKSAATPLPVMVSSGAWYHDAAIREGDPSRKD